ncbi:MULTISPECIES: T9SS type A sorting domain-containing protein [Flavobacterium]|uniref:T9SS type A sorting domain-containing protein n=1 Tax=Flavobacterium jumunjinense TaxID=998845 RepID=A0ABV5GST8_9FLAO|nr:MULTISPECIES: T9SS type A sorting domain-containing protein [Flavobacterium]
MTKSKRLSFLTVVCFTFSVANCLAQESVNSSGGDLAGSNGSASYSVGQVVYMTYTGSNGSVSEGVQQPFEISEVLGTEDFAGLIKDLKIYPNPTVNDLTLNLTNENDLVLNFQILDANGRVLKDEKILTNETNIAVSSLPSAIYFLKILNQNKEVKTFKIIKK